MSCFLAYCPSVHALLRDRCAQEGARVKINTLEDNKTDDIISKNFETPRGHTCRTIISTLQRNEVIIMRCMHKVKFQFLLVPY